MKRPGHSRAPSMTAKQRRVTLRYADWWAGKRETVTLAGTGRSMDLAMFISSDDVVYGVGKESDLDRSLVLCSLAYDGTDGP